MFSVSSLFPVPFAPEKQHCVSITYERLSGFQEEDYDGRLCRIILLPVALLLFYGVNLELYATIKIM